MKLSKFFQCNFFAGFESLWATMTDLQ